MAGIKPGNAAARTEAAGKRDCYLAALAIGTLPFIVNGYVNSLVFKNPPLYWALELAYWVAIPTAVFWYAVRRGGFRFAEIGLSGEIRGRRNLALLVLLCAVFCPLDAILYKELYAYFSTRFPPSPVFAYESVVPEQGISRQVVAIYFALTAGIVEELYYRGLCFRIASFFPRPVVLYLALSPLLFALIHWEGGMANVCATYAFGMIQAVAFLGMRNLWPLIAGHVYTDYVWFW